MHVPPEDDASEAEAIEGLIALAIEMESEAKARDEAAEAGVAARQARH